MLSRSDLIEQASIAISKIRDFMTHEWPYYRKRLTKKYYIIRRPELGAGFFSNYWWVMGHVVFANKLGYIPVVDMENYRTLYSEDEPVYGETNAWNYYFENVGKASLKEAYVSGKYVFAEERPLNKYANRFCQAEYRFPTERAIDFYFPVIKKHMRIRPELEKDFERQWMDETKGHHVLGIHVRGTDMRNDLGHPVPAETQKYIEQAKILVNRYPEIDRIFLATDEENILHLFEEAFDKKEQKPFIFWNPAFRNRKEQEYGKATGIHEQKPDHMREHHRYLMGLEVLRDAFFLARCDYLLCGHSNITNVVILWNNHRYKDIICLEHK